MPFIDAPSRMRLLDPKEKPTTPGELCFIFYKPMVEAWKQKQSWSLFHTMVGAAFGWNDMQTAKVLALVMFFCEHVLPYEARKKAENGDIL